MTPPPPAAPLRRRRAGFTLVEVAVAILLVVLVGVGANAALRMSLRTLSGSEVTDVAVAAVRQFREWTFPMTLADVEALNGQRMAPVMGDGQPLPGADNLELEISVVAVDDRDITQVVAPEESRTRLLTVSVYSADRFVLSARWLVTDPTAEG